MGYTPELSGAAVVCGAGSGIGRAVAITLARRGISYLTCGDIDLEKAEETLELAARATDPDKTLFIGRAVQVDIRSELDVEAFFSVARNLSPRIDICVNTAGFGAAGSLISNMPIDEYRAQVEVHNIGGFLFLRTALRTLLVQGLQVPEGGKFPTRGSIVMLTSLASEGAFKGVGNYTAAKWAIKGLVQTAAIENAREGIRVNAVAPSYVSGPMIKASFKEIEGLEDQTISDLPIPRLVTAEEVAESVLFLASGRSGYVNGHTLVMDGGASLQLANQPFTN